MSSKKRSFRSFRRARDGGASILTALSGTAMIGFVGLAVDTGSVFLETRRLQGTADLAAIAGAQQPGNAEALAAATVSANNWPSDARMDVTAGAYTADRDIAPSQRFKPGRSGANAVRVQVTTSAPLYFGRLFIPSGRMQITRVATAAQTRLASFQLGSGLAALEGGIANDVLSGLTGSSVSLSVMDYNALVSADVELFAYVSALRTRLDIDAATFNETLSQRVEIGDAIAAIADTLATQRSSGEAPMRRLAASASRMGRLDNLNALLDLGPYGAQQIALSPQSSQVKVNALDLATAMLEIAGGDRQVRLNMQARVPGLEASDVWLAIGERPNHAPWLAVTSNDAVTIRTAQARLYIDAKVRPTSALSGVAQVRVPILVELASAQARLRDITCGLDRRNTSVTISTAPSTGSLSLGDIDIGRLDDFRSALAVRPADLVRVTLLRVTGQARVDLGGERWFDLRFSGDDIARGVMQTAQTRDIAQTTISSLLGATRLDVRVGGLGVGASAASATLQNTLTAAARPIDQLVNGLTDVLGLRIGTADVRVNGVRCGGAALVG